MADMALAGRLLVANPLLPDPNFDRTVVLILVHNDQGAVGVVLNRPSDTSISIPLPEWEPLAAAPAVVFVGGPVSHDAALCLGQIAGGGHTSPGAVGGWSPIAGDVGTVDLDALPDGLRSEVTTLRIFAGYAGWDEGQLEAEIAAGAWWIVAAEPADVFCDDPGGLWKQVLRRQGGQLAVVSAYPADPSMN